MKRLIGSILIFSISYSLGFTSLTIDTNTLILTNNSVTNVELNKVIEPELPNLFLRTGKIEYEPPETPARRFDVVYFVAIPITYYLLFSLLIIKNQWANSGRQLDNTDYNYIYTSTFVVPMAIAYYDYLYVEQQKKMKEQLAYQKNEQIIPDIQINLFALKF